MKRSPSAIIIAVMAVLIAVLTWALIYFARDELDLMAEEPEDEIPLQSGVSEQDGFAVVRISTAGQQASGIVTQPLERASAQASADVYGLVMDIQPLIELRARYIAAVSEASALRAVVANSEAELRRVEALFKDERNVSERAVQAARSQWNADQARLAGAEQVIATAEQNLRAAWGDALSNWATNPESEAYDALARQRQVLVQIVFPYELEVQPDKAGLVIAPAAAQAARHKARYVSRAPQSDATMPGRTFFYVVPADGLRAGMRVLGRLNLGGSVRTGVTVPNAAVVWHGGKAWAYVKQDPEQFVRKEVLSLDELADGYFTARNFNAGDQLVVSGAQLLLSEEMKLQIRNENED